MDFEKGQILNGMYQIDSHIGSGGGGVVYKATHLRLQTDVVIKKIKDNALNKLTIRQEADILKRLKHPYLPRVYDFVETPQAVYTVMDYIPGISLSDALKARGRFTVQEVFKWAQQLGEALSYLHSRKPAIIHGDIKPANIMLTPDGNICLIDFNIALACGSNQYAAVGISARYSPPEQYRDSQIYAQVTSRYSNLPITHTAASAMGHFGKGITPRSDLYALGATLYHLLIGVAPTQEYDQIVSLSQYDLPIGEGFRHVIETLMRVNPLERYEDGTAYLSALRSCYKMDAAYRQKQRRSLLTKILIMIFIAALSIAGFSGYVFYNHLQEQTFQKHLAKAYQCLSEMDYESAEEAIELAREKKPARIESYVLQLQMLYEQMEYEECATLGEQYLNDDYFHVRNKDNQQLGDVYYLTGNAYLELDAYQGARDAFEFALDSYSKNPLYYRDYAITLARMGNTDAADEQLDEAISQDLLEDSIYMVKAEIAMAKSDYEESIHCLEKVLSLTDDRQMEIRSYFLLARANIKLAKENEENSDSYHKAALDAMSTLESMGIHTYRIQESTAVIYEQLGEYGEAERRFHQLAKDYPNRYEVYCRLSYLEIDIQSTLDNQDRDYHKAEEYYLKAKEMQPPGKEDVEMEVLEQMMQDIRDGGWL